MDDSLESLLLDFFLYQMNDVYTALPCKVIRVQDAAKGILDVQPLIKRKGFDGVDTDRPILLGVPLFTLGTRKSLVRIPVEAGDYVLCVFSQRGLDAFKSGDGSLQAPTDYRIFDKRDAVAIPGLFPFDLHPNLSRTLESKSTDLSLTHNIGTANEVTLRLTEGGEFKIVAPTKTVSVDCASLVMGATTRVDLNAPLINFNGVVMINGVAYTLHTHAGVTPGTGVSGPVVV